MKLPVFTIIINIISSIILGLLSILVVNFTFFQELVLFTCIFILFSVLLFIYDILNKILIILLEKENKK
jgi:hypothetical protein